MLDPQQWTRDLLNAHGTDLRPFWGFRESTLPSGMRIIDAYSASGLSFTLLPDRGMDIFSASYKGLPLTWFNPGAPHVADWGQPWLRQFNGGLLTTCGPAQVGPPETDEITGERRDIHGNFSRLRTQRYWIDDPVWDDLRDGMQRAEMHLHATLYDAPIFGVQLKIERTVIISLQHADIGIYDTITNEGDLPAPFMFLYHVNVGFPLLQAGSRLYTPNAQVYPRDATARATLDTWSHYEAPSAGFAEQVYFHRLKRTPPLKGENEQDDSGLSKGGIAQVLVTDPSATLGLVVGWDDAVMPYFTQWKNTRQGQNVCGIEPGNAIPEGQNAARRNGRLATLQPGQTVTTYLSLDVLDNAETIKHRIERIQQIAETGEPHPDCHLDDFATNR